MLGRFSKLASERRRGASGVQVVEDGLRLVTRGGTLIPIALPGVELKVDEILG